MEFFGFAITLLSVVIAIQTWRNGRWMKEMLRVIHQEGEERHQEVVKLMEKMDERMDRRHQEVVKLFHGVVKLMEKMDERTAKIAELIKNQKSIS